MFCTTSTSNKYPVHAQLFHDPEGVQIVVSITIVVTAFIIVVIMFGFTAVILNIGTCVPVFVKSAHASGSTVIGMHSLVRFGQRTVSSPGASIWLFRAEEYLGNDPGTHSPVCFRQRTVSSPDVGICWYNLGMPTPGLLTVRCPKPTGNCVPATSLPPA